MSNYVVPVVRHGVVEHEILPNRFLSKSSFLDMPNHNNYEQEIRRMICFHFFHSMHTVRGGGLWSYNLLREKYDQTGKK